ncbi:MAG: hypothetical protein PHW21_07195, partial [Candidatus Izemoplasmatales bacterium]|nr:hypothetical protein [Candidatus Izemoplasmatales bacterium]
LLETIHSTYMWGSRVPADLSEKHHLVEKEVLDSDKVYKDVLIYKKGYRMSEVDKQFLTCLIEQKRIVMKKANVD